MDQNEDKLKLLQAISSAFGKNYPPEVYELWLEVIEDRSLEDLRSGIKELLKTSKFMPSIAEIRNAAIEHFAPIKKPEAKKETWTQAEAQAFLEEQESYADEEI